jgi:hypothetical protein
LFKDSNAGEIIDAISGCSGSGIPIAINQMNLNMVVYKGGITLNNSLTGEDISLVFLVSERSAHSIAPEIDASGDPELIVSLYTPLGELYGTYKALPGDNVVSVGVPASDNDASGEWTYVVEEVHGFDGGRVVLFAAVDGLYDVYDEEWDGTFDPGGNDPYDIIIRGMRTTAVNGATQPGRNYPRGFVSGTFHHQLGDGKNEITDQSIRDISFGPFVRPQDIEVLHVDDDLVLKTKGTTDKVVIPGWFRTATALNIDFRHDKTSWNATDIARKAVVKEPDINFHVVSTDEYIKGTEDNDRLRGGDKNTLFLPGKGNDAVIFGKGGNTLYYRMNEGNDTIEGNREEGAYRDIRFHDDITSADVAAFRNGNDMVISIKDGSITVIGWYSSPKSKIDTIQFCNNSGEIWDARDIEKLANHTPLTKREVVMTFDERLASQERGNGLSDTSGGSGCAASGSLSLLGIIGIAVAALGITKNRRGNSRVSK